MQKESIVYEKFDIFQAEIDVGKCLTLLLKNVEILYKLHKKENYFPALDVVYCQKSNTQIEANNCSTYGKRQR